jgi:glutamate racemase
MIGVFDSGHGGLTVLQAMVDALPQRQFVYLGDHGHAPYGNRTPDEIYGLTIAAVEQLFALDCRLVLLACNTAAATALRRLQQGWLPGHAPDRRVLGVLVPMVEAITGMPWMADVAPAGHVGEPRTIAVFATRQTVASNAFPREVNKRAPEVTVVQQACPNLAALIEDGAPRAVLADTVHRYVAELMDKLAGEPPQAVILGCTHYPLVIDMFADALPPGVDILSQPVLAARSLAAYLTGHAGLDRCPALPQPVRFYTSGAPSRVSRLASALYGREVVFEGIEEGLQAAARARSGLTL